MKKMSLPSRITVAIASLSLIATYYLPVWFIFLIAPQYPEGLTMQIWLNKITGQVDIINGLNHYIGMKHIKAEMFPEFGYLIYIVGALIVLGLLTSIIGKRKVLFAYILLILAFAVAAMVDFYKWGYDYGHNLDPKAAIQVPGLYYQPPLIGHKTLLNFDAYSYPDVGGWIVIVAGALFIGVWVWEKYRARKKATKTKHVATTVAVASLIFLLQSCASKPEPIHYGKDACSFCKMNITDPHFGGEVVTKKGRTYKFDDLHCMVGFLKSGEVKPENISQTLAVNYEKENDFIDINKAALIQSEELHSPMNGNTAAFITEAAANSTKEKLKATSIRWETLLSITK
jgi:copper chaperone NosL